MTYRDERPRCASCADDRALVVAAERPTHLCCEHCRGVLVPAGEVEEMVSSLQVVPFELAGGTPGERTCPRCTARMARLTVLGVEIDRCANHGVWFDGGELERVLETATGVDPDSIATGTPERGALGLLRSLFGARRTAPWSPRRPPDDVT